MIGVTGNMTAPSLHHPISELSYQTDLNSNISNKTRKDGDQVREKLLTTSSGVRRVLQVGLDHWFDDAGKSVFAGFPRIILVSPGNPGEILFCKQFMVQLNQRIGLPVIGAGYAGLSKSCRRTTSGPLTVRRLVDDQIRFIEDFIPPEVEIILIGHSIGTFIATEVMKVSESRNRFVHTVLMMPVLQNLRSTPGAYVVRILSHVSYVLYAGIFLLSLLPHKLIKRMFGSMCDLLWDTSDCSVDALIELVDVSSVRNAITLAMDEFNQVQDLDERFLSANLKRLSFVFAEVDEWVPRKAVANFMHVFPEADAVIVPETLHTFFFSEKMTNAILDAVCKPLNEFKVDKESTSVSE